MSMASTAVSTTTKMLAAMCVRKTGDSGSQREVIGSSSNAAVKKKHKSFKVVTMKSRSSQRETKRDKERDLDERHVIAPKVHVQDDEDGHLIYRKGDLLDMRCGFGREREAGVHGDQWQFDPFCNVHGAKIDLHYT